MAEYIKRDYVNQIISHYARGQEDKTKDLLAIIEQSIYALPNADVVERKKGKWIRNDESRTVCSLCGNVVAFVSHPDRRWDFGNYCPNCGAMMEES